MRIQLNTLRFNLSSSPFGSDIKKIADLGSDLETVSKQVGTDNNKFKAAWKKVYEAILSDEPIEKVLNDRVDVRALGFAFLNKREKSIKISKDVLSRIDSIVEKPSSLFIENIFQYYLNEFSDIENIKELSQWIIKARASRKVEQWYDKGLLSVNGAAWVAELAITRKKDFDQVLSDLKLDLFKSGQFMQAAQQIYYVEQLRNIPTNQPHALLLEVQKPEVFKAKFNESELLGHQVLRILINKAPEHDINDAWLNTIMAIAGDPRISVSNPRFIKWWSHFSKDMILKVNGWLSGLDLKLFLDALEDFSLSSSDQDMKRMFPSRKKFLEGLYDKKLIKNTKLYMCKNMAQYLYSKYKKEHLPDFSIVEDGEKSIIYVDLKNAHLIEGSHQCKLWIYRVLHDSAPVLRYEKQRKSYRSLTIGLHEAMHRHGEGACDYFTHSPHHFNWQIKAIQALKNLSVPVTIKDVLTPDDYRVYVRRFGEN